MRDLFFRGVFSFIRGGTLQMRMIFNIIIIIYLRRRFKLFFRFGSTICSAPPNNCIPGC